MPIKPPDIMAVIILRCRYSAVAYEMSSNIEGGIESCGRSRDPAPARNKLIYHPFHQY